MPLLWVSLAFLIGLFLGEILPANEHSTGSYWAAAAAGSLVMWAVLRFIPSRPGILGKLRWTSLRHPYLCVPPVVLLVFIFAGAARFTLNSPDLAHGHIAALNDTGTFRIQAVVAAPPDRRDYATLVRLVIEGAAAVEENQPPKPLLPAHGTALAVFPPGTEMEYGERVLMTASPVTPPEGEEFSYRDYLGRQDIYTYIIYPQIEQRGTGAGNPLLTAIYTFRDLALKKIYHLFPAPEAPLLAGILLGIDQGITPALARAFQDTGTAHVIAISGFNIAILAELFSRLFGKVLSRWWATLAAILAVLFYTILVGATPSVVRAAIMGSLALIAEQIGRRSTALNSLAFSAALMCCANPLLPWDTSFQLSFFATLGLVTFGSRFQNSLTGFLDRRFSTALSQKIAAPIGEYILLTLAAQLMTLPIILYHFQRLSVSSLLANPLILPVQPLVMILSGAAVLAGLTLDPLGHLLAWAAWPLSAYTIRVVEALANLPGAVLILGKMNLPAAALLYGVIMAPLCGVKFPKLWKNLLRPGLVLTILALGAILAFRAALTRPDGKIHLTILNLNSSQAVFIRGPGGETALVNGGPSTQLLNDAFGRRLSPFERRLDVLIINAARANALNSLPGILDLYQTQQALWGSAPDDSLRISKRLVEGFKTQGTPEHRLVAGEALTLGTGTLLEILLVEEQGSALLLHRDNFRVLIPSGVSPKKIARKDLSNLSALVLEDRDLETTKPETWSGFAPQAIVYTPGEGTLPVERVNWLNTLPGGWVHFAADGQQMWVEAEAMSTIPP